MRVAANARDAVQRACEAFSQACADFGVTGARADDAREMILCASALWKISGMRSPVSEISGVALGRECIKWGIAQWCGRHADRFSLENNDSTVRIFFKDDSSPNGVVVPVSEALLSQHAPTAFWDTWISRKRLADLESEHGALIAARYDVPCAPMTVCDAQALLEQAWSHPAPVKLLGGYDLTETCRLGTVSLWTGLAMVRAAGGDPLLERGVAYAFIDDGGGIVDGFCGSRVAQELRVSGFSEFVGHHGLAAAQWLSSGLVMDNLLSRPDSGMQ